MSFSQLASAQAFADVSRENRLLLAVELARALGDEFAPSPELRGAAQLPSIVHTPSGCEFIAIVGGEFEMGLSEADIEDLSEYVNWTNDIAEFIDAHRVRATPVHRVQVAPFLVSNGILRDPMWGVKVDEGEGDRAQEVAALLNAAPRGVRLPSEAEYEYLARAGGEYHFVADGARSWQEDQCFPGKHPWGVWELEYRQWVADSWHVNYQGAPSTSEPWEPLDLPEVFRGMLPEGLAQDHEELIYALCALRGKADPPIVDDHNSDRHFFIRLVIELPRAGVNGLETNEPVLLFEPDPA